MFQDRIPVEETMERASITLSRIQMNLLPIVVVDPEISRPQMSYAMRATTAAEMVCRVGNGIDRGSGNLPEPTETS